MGYKFNISAPWYKTNRDEVEYPWPCPSQPTRTITIYSDDVLTRSKNGTYMKHTGLGCFNIKIPDEDLIPQTEEIRLQIL